jgi:ABC-type antimicrobial peptide transport system permease subunit
LNREPYTVIGVLPRQYFSTGPEILVPLDLTFDTNVAWGVQARLERGVTPRMAGQRLSALLPRWSIGNLNDPVVLVAVSLVLFVVAVVSVAIPANRAASIQPVDALRID